MSEKEKGKIIKGPIHGFIELSPLQEELLSQPEVQRLTWIKQLGLVLMVYPGGHQTRLEHSLGTSHLCSKISDALDLEERERKLLEAAGMLHDLGHAPFSHAIELIMPKKHTELTRDLILGKSQMPDSGGVLSVLENYGLEPEEVADLVTGDFGGEKYLQDIINSQMDADQLDYLARDSHYTGVSYGAIEVEWIINMMRINEGRLTYLDKGLDALEDFLIARDHMYSSVYLYKAVNIAEEMLLRAVKRYGEDNDLKEAMWMTDGKLFEALKNSNPYSREMAKRLKQRNLYKQAYTVKNIDTESKRNKMRAIDEKNRDRMEEEIAKEAGAERKEIMINKQEGLLDKVEPRVREFNIKISKDGEVLPLEKISKIAQSLKEKDPVRNLFSVYTTPEYREEVRRIVKGDFP